MGRLNNPKQEAFCQEYLLDFNGAQAAIRVGYSQKAARQIADELLTKTDISARVAELNAERAARLQLSADGVLNELKKVAFANLGDFLRMTPEGRSRALHGDRL